MKTGTDEEIAAKRALRAAKRAAASLLPGQEGSTQPVSAKKRIRSPEEIPHSIKRWMTPPPVELCRPYNELPRFLWTEDCARKFFMGKKLWPSFIGMRATHDEQEAGALPIYIWNEQRALLGEQISSDRYSLNVIRCEVFRDLHSRGYVVGPADGYGADYSLYKEDPSTSHSIATVRVIENPGKDSATISAKEILSYSRVQNHVNKKGVFAIIASSECLKIDLGEAFEAREQRTEKDECISSSSLSLFSFSSSSSSLPSSGLLTSFSSKKQKEVHVKYLVTDFLGVSKRI